MLLAALFVLAVSFFFWHRFSLSMCLEGAEQQAVS